MLHYPRLLKLVQGVALHKNPMHYLNPLLGHLVVIHKNLVLQLMMSFLRPGLLVDYHKNLWQIQGSHRQNHHNFCTKIQVDRSDPRIPPCRYIENRHGKYLQLNDATIFQLQLGGIYLSLLIRITCLDIFD